MAFPMPPAPLVRCLDLAMFDGHPLALTGWLEADQAEVTVLHRPEDDGALRATVFAPRARAWSSPVPLRWSPLDTSAGLWAAPLQPSCLGRLTLSMRRNRMRAGSWIEVVGLMKLRPFVAEPAGFAA
ncbi:MAG: hypothetical protein JO069_09925 [Verrucomicrobia bacterium]|nr:hypothetical protein [Verrucomicrobiota bacterium]